MNNKIQQPLNVFLHWFLLVAVFVLAVRFAAGQEADYPPEWVKNRIAVPQIVKRFGNNYSIYVHHGSTIFIIGPISKEDSSVAMGTAIRELRAVAETIAIPRRYAVIYHRSIIQEDGCLEQGIWDYEGRKYDHCYIGLTDMGTYELPVIFLVSRDVGILIHEIRHMLYYLIRKDERCKFYPQITTTHMIGHGGACDPLGSGRPWGVAYGSLERR